MGPLETQNNGYSLITPQATMTKNWQMLQKWLQNNPKWLIMTKNGYSPTTSWPGGYGFCISAPKFVLFLDQLTLLKTQLILLSPGSYYFRSSLYYPPGVNCPTLLKVDKAI